MTECGELGGEGSAGAVSSHLAVEQYVVVVVSMSNNIICLLFLHLPIDPLVGSRTP